jgi:hypothetical protein
MFAAVTALRHGGFKIKNKKEEKLTMRVTNKLFALPRVIAFAGVLLIGGPAFADISVDVDKVDLLGNRTDVEVDLTATCTNTADTGNVTVSIYQSVGRIVNIATGTSSFACSDGTQQITVSLPDGNLKFQPGPATLYITGSTTDINNVTSPTFEFGAKVNLH